MNAKSAFTVLITLASMLVSQLTNASESGFYIGAGLGDVTSRLHDYSHASATKIFAGYSFNESFSIEAGYISTSTFDAGFVLFSPSGYKFQGGTLSLIGSIPVGHDFSLFCKGGVWGWNNTTLIYGTSDTVTGVGAVGGGGVEYMMTRHVGLRAEFEYLYFNGTSNRVGDASSISANLVGRF